MGITSRDRQRRPTRSDLAGSQFSSAELPPGLVERALAGRPDLTPAQFYRTESGLRQWYEVNFLAGGQPVAMPSRLVDLAWHEHICHTRHYAAFCQSAFGRFLHHTPESAMTAGERAANATSSAARTWELACSAERIDPYSPPRLPRIFAVDDDCRLDGAVHYRIDCRGAVCHVRGPEVCVRHQLQPLLPTMAVRSSPARRRRRRQRGLWADGGGDGNWVDPGGGADAGSSGCGGGGCSGGG